MTLDGTNSYLVGAPGSGVVVVDPGPLHDAHLTALASAGDVELVLVTHRHNDHTESVHRFAAMTGATVRAIEPRFCVGAEPLLDGERLRAAGVSIDVIATPGHTADSVSFRLPDDGPHGSVLTGDTILGRGTTVLSAPDGSLTDYLHSLRRLRALGSSTVLPAHGPVLPDLVAVCDSYLEHRERRLAAVRAAVDELGEEATVEQVTDLVYADADPAVRFAAEASVRAQLDYLRA